VTAIIRVIDNKIIHRLQGYV